MIVQATMACRYSYVKLFQPYPCMRLKEHVVQGVLVVLWKCFKELSNHVFQQRDKLWSLDQTLPLSHPSYPSPPPYFPTSAAFSPLTLFSPLPLPSSPSLSLASQLHSLFPSSTCFNVYPSRGCLYFLRSFSIPSSILFPFPSLPLSPGWKRLPTQETGAKSSCQSPATSWAST